MGPDTFRVAHEKLLLSYFQRSTDQKHRICHRRQDDQVEWIPEQVNVGLKILEDARRDRSIELEAARNHNEDEEGEYDELARVQEDIVGGGKQGNAGGRNEGDKSRAKPTLEADRALPIICAVAGQYLW